MTDLEWEYARCPICGLGYPYVKGSCKPKTCGKFDCVQKYHRLQISLQIRKEVVSSKRGNSKE